MGGWERRPALDGLRGVALAMVVLFHGGVGVVGGAIGVDVFLVLSGYLITGLLLLEHDRTGRIDLRAFWARRARRLVPAAVVLVAVVALFGGADGLDAGAALGWWSNWRFALADVGYFDAFGSPSPLRHTWSLAVEEQWYVLWPPLLLLLQRSGRRLPLTLALALASAGAMWLLASDVDRVHMGTDTRAQGLLVGAALAMVLHGGRTFPRAASTAAGLAGAAVLGAIALRTPGTEPWLYRGGHLLVAVASAAVVAAAIRPDGPVRAALALRPLRAVGRVSYGAYLWHWPLFVWLTPASTGLDPWPLFAVRVAATAAATVLSWHLVERPLLDGRPLPRPRLALPTAVGVATAVVVATLAFDPTVRATDGSASVSVSSAEPELPAGYARPAAPKSPPPRDPAPAAALAPPAPRPVAGEPVVTVVGDSSAWALAWQIGDVPGMVVRDGGSIGCGVDPAPVLVGGVTRVEAGMPVPCPEALDLWRWWATSTDPDLVVLGLGAWEVYDRVLDDGRHLEVGTRAWTSWLEAGVERVVTALAEAAPHARIALTEVPCYAERDLALGGPTSPRNDPERVATVNEVLADVVAAHPARLVTIPLSGWLCGSGEYARPDGVHLVPESARALWTGPLGAWVHAELGR